MKEWNDFRLDLLISHAHTARCYGNILPKKNKKIMKMNKCQLTFRDARDLISIAYFNFIFNTSLLFFFFFRFYLSLSMFTCHNFYISLFTSESFILFISSLLSRNKTIPKLWLMSVQTYTRSIYRYSYCCFFSLL